LVFHFLPHQFSDLFNRLDRTITDDLSPFSPQSGSIPQYRLGKSFDSSTGFILPNGAIRSPDTAWIAQQCWDSLTQQQQEQFVPLCPDFVVELLSPSDNLDQTRQKMQEYLDQGVRLGWLILFQQQRVEIYRPQQPVEVQENPTMLSGETVLPEFELDLTEIW